MADVPTDAELIEAYDATYNRMRTFDRHVHALRAVVEKFTPSPPVAAPPATPMTPTADQMFLALAHGDDVPRAWLRDAIDALFAGRPVPAVRSQPQPQPAQPLTGAGWPSQPLRSPDCWCGACDSAANQGWRSRMSLCPNCGDKRCPRAENHDKQCTAPSTPTPPEVAP